MVDAATKSITNPISLKTIEEINNLWKAELEIKKDDYIAPKSYIEFNKKLYIAERISKVVDKGRITFKVKLHHNMVELNRKSIAPFVYSGQTPTQMMATILAGTRWSVGTVDITSTSTIKNDDRITCLAALMMVVRQFNGEIYFNCVKQPDQTWTRTVDLKTAIGDQTTKHMVRYDKNSDHIERIEDPQKLCTRLYIYGADNTTIASVNGGLDYLDSTHINDYSEPFETTLYTQINDPTRLKAYGLIYLGLYEHTLFSYILDVFDKSIFPLWTVETFNIGDKIRVYNLDLDLNVDCRIQRIEKDLTKGTMRIELENLVDKITDLLAKLNYYISKPYTGSAGDYVPPVYDDNPFLPEELPIEVTPEEEPEGDPIEIPMAGMYLIKADTNADGGSLMYVARKKIVVDSLGQFWCVYSRYDGSNYHVYCSRSENGQIWTETKLTESDIGGDPLEDMINFTIPVIAIDSNNVVYVAFRALSSGNAGRIYFVAYDGGWSTQAEVFAGNYMDNANIAIDENDTVHIIALNGYGAGHLYHKSSSDGGASWSSSVEIEHTQTSNIGSATAFEVGLNGVLYVCFAEISGGVSRVCYVTSLDGGANWSVAAPINNAGISSDTVSIAMDSQNNVHAIWVEHPGGVGVLYYSKIVAGIASTPLRLSGTGAVLGGTISVDNNDKLYVVWAGMKGDYRQLKFRIFDGIGWSLETTQTSSFPSKRYPTLIQSQWPLANDMRYNISRDGFIVIFTIDDDIWIWFNSYWHL